MRKKRNNQLEFDFQPSNLPVTVEYFARYEAISGLLDNRPELVDLVHGDLKKLLKRRQRGGPGRKCKFASETVLRVLIAQIIEGESLRGIVIRIDDSHYLRNFVRIYNAEMFDFTTLSTLKNAIREKTWKRINEALAKSAVDEGLIDGKRLRADTTAYETNIRWPSDSRLLWDTYRALALLIARARQVDGSIAEDRRLQRKRAKRLYAKIARHSRRKNASRETLKNLYEPLISLVCRLLALTRSACEQLRSGIEQGTYGHAQSAVVRILAALKDFEKLGCRVTDQAQRRVLQGEQVPNDEKLFSLFEPHTELLKRGKAGKAIEFGHMVAFDQVDGKFITNYEVFRKKPVEHTLVDPALQKHRNLFGRYPDEFSADKGYYESPERLKALEALVPVVSIAKKGRRTQEEVLRESTKSFRLGQSFRAGIEGTISFLKRALGMSRCMNKGWDHYTTTVGATVFVHNLLVLARTYG